MRDIMARLELRLAEWYIRVLAVLFPKAMGFAQEMRDTTLDYKGHITASVTWPFKHRVIWHCFRAIRNRDDLIKLINDGYWT